MANEKSDCSSSVRRGSQQLMLGQQLTASFTIMKLSLGFVLVTLGQICSGVRFTYTQTDKFVAYNGSQNSSLDQRGEWQRPKTTETSRS